MRRDKEKKMFFEKIVFEGRKFDICLRPDADESIVAEIFKWREYGSAEVIIKMANLPIVDVGAHIGVFSLYASALNPQAKIYALEPEKENFDLLLRNISANRLGNVKAVRAALASSSGERELAIAPDSINHRLVEAEDGGIVVRREKIPAFSFADFLDVYHIAAAGLVKMDIEGGEYEVFGAMADADFGRMQSVILEYHEYGGHRYRELEEMFRRRGFSVEIFPSRFENGLGFLFARNKRFDAQFFTTR
jgi:FkbM family methyltransferase